MSVVAAGLLFLCTPTAVWDGDGPVWCAERIRSGGMDRPIRIRLAGIAARETDGSCRRWQPCPPASAEAATGALVDLLGGRQGERSTGHVLVSGPQLRCRSDGPARGDRTAAWCELPDGRDLSCAMVGTGTVAIWPRFWGDHSCSRPDR